MTMTDLEQDFTVSRIVKAPRGRVWRAYSEADQFAKWWGPRGADIRVLSFDFRPGGMFHYAMEFEPGYPTYGRFLYGSSASRRPEYVNGFSDENGASLLLLLHLLFFFFFMASSCGEGWRNDRDRPVNADQRHACRQSGTFVGMFHFNTRQLLRGIFDKLDALLGNNEISMLKTISIIVAVLAVVLLMLPPTPAMTQPDIFRVQRDDHRRAADRKWARISFDLRRGAEWLLYEKGPGHEEDLQRAGDRPRGETEWDGPGRCRRRHAHGRRRHAVQDAAQARHDPPDDGEQRSRILPRAQRNATTATWALHGPMPRSPRSCACSWTSTRWSEPTWSVGRKKSSRCSPSAYCYL